MKREVVGSGAPGISQAVYGCRGGSPPAPSAAGLTSLSPPAPAVLGCSPGRLPTRLPFLPGIAAEALLQELRQAGAGRPPSATFHHLRQRPSLASPCVPWGACGPVATGAPDPRTQDH